MLGVVFSMVVVLGYGDYVEDVLYDLVLVDVGGFCFEG